MTKEKAVGDEDHYLKRLYPGTAYNSSYIKRIDNREESLLGTFIQWVGPPRISTGDNKEQTHSIEDDHIRNASRVEFPSHCLIGSPDFLSNSNNENGSSKLGKTTTKLLDKATPQPTNKHKSSQDAHSYTDKYRIMYLLVRVEQQQLHLRHVIENLKRLGRPKSETTNMVNVLKGISKMHGLLVGLRDNDLAMIKHIGDRNDTEEFLLTVENTCSSVEEIPVPGTSDDKTSRMVNHTTNTMDKMARFVNHTTDTIHDKMTRLGNHTANTVDDKMARLVNHTAITNDDKVARLMNHTANTIGDKMARLVNHTKQGGEIKTHYTNNPNKKETNETNIWAQPKLRPRKNTPPNCRDVMLKKLQSLSPTGQEVSITLNGGVQGPTGTKQEHILTKQDSSTKAVRSLPDIDQQGMEGSELNTLMKEIDALMDDAGLIKDKKEKMLSYEVIMLGAGENKRKQTNHKQTNHKHISHKKQANQSDVFIEELDKLLDECGSV